MFGFGKKQQKRGAEADLERFRTENRAEIRRVLSDLARRNELATIYFNGGKEFILSAVVGFDQAARRIYLDYGADEEDNQRMLHGERRIVVSSQNRVRIQFSVQSISPSTWEGHAAFAVGIPDTLIRVQRREFFRIDTPVAHPLVCRFTTRTGYTYSATVVDLSVGGVGLLEPRSLPPGALVLGEKVPACRIELPGYGVVETGFEVRNAKMQPTGSGELHRRVGCQFSDLDARTAGRLQRYIQKLELERARMAREK